MCLLRMPKLHRRSLTITNVAIATGGSLTELSELLFIIRLSIAYQYTTMTIKVSDGTK